MSDLAENAAAIRKRLSEIDDRRSESVPEPWDLVADSETVRVVGVGGFPVALVGTPDNPDVMGNARFIAAARGDVKWLVCLAGMLLDEAGELAAEVVRLREESARVGRCGDEFRRLYPDGRAEPTFCALPAGHAGWHRDDNGTTEWNDPEPTPRDGDLTRLLRDAMRRFGVPAVMAEAGRLAQQRL